MGTKEKLLDGLNLTTMCGVEIGALARPNVKKSDGKIFYIDYADADFLKKRYKNDPMVDVDCIVNVDGIWGKNTLLECLGSTAPVDYIIASHVIEHVPDLITWLKELRSILKPSGQVRLAVPDRRYSFDFHRKETGVAQVLEAFYFRARVPAVQQVFDHLLNIVDVDTGRIWGGQYPSYPVKSESDLAGVMHLADDISRNHAYHDVHCWVFTPESMSRLFISLAQVGIGNFECESFQDTESGQLEFFVTLRACDEKEKIIKSWERVLTSLHEY